MTGQRL